MTTFSNSTVEMGVVKSKNNINIDCRLLNSTKCRSMFAKFSVELLFMG